MCLIDRLINSNAHGLSQNMQDFFVVERIILFKSTLEFQFEKEDLEQSCHLSNILHGQNMLFKILPNKSAEIPTKPYQFRDKHNPISFINSQTYIYQDLS